MSSERHLTVSDTNLDSMDAALAWAVQTADREFGSRPNQIRLVSSYVLTDDGGTREMWAAAVSGCVPPPAVTP